MESFQIMWLLQRAPYMYAYPVEQSKSWKTEKNIEMIQTAI